MSALPQHLCALERANEVRFGHAALKRELRTGEITVEEALADARAPSLPIGLLLAAQRRWGESRSEALLDELRIWPRKRTGELTDRQRRMIVDLIEGR